MRNIWGAVTEVSDLGVVAEHCPHCERVVPCLLRSVCRGHYVLFVRTEAHAVERSCLCTLCLGAFACEHWRYATFVPVAEAKGLAVDDLLARTNPGLAERLHLKEQVCALGGDARFAAAYEQLEGLRPGALRSGLLKRLLDWDRLTEAQRVVLGKQIGDLGRAWRFARQIAPTFPGHAGCVTILLAALLVLLLFLWAPEVRGWPWGAIAVVAGGGAAALASHLLLTRRVSQWTRKELIPEAEIANVSLACFLTVVDDLPGSRLGMLEELWPVKIQIKTISVVLAAEGKI
jgi:hypothetical protein